MCHPLIFSSAQLWLGSTWAPAQFLARLSFGSGGGHSAHTAAQTTQYSSPDCELRAHPRDYDVGGAESGWVVWPLQGHILPFTTAQQRDHHLGHHLIKGLVDALHRPRAALDKQCALRARERLGLLARDLTPSFKVDFVHDKHEHRAWSEESAERTRDPGKTARVHNRRCTGSFAWIPGPPSDWLSVADIILCFLPHRIAQWPRNVDDLHTDR